ncbi:MAG: hypothetical protein K2J71_04355 [Oscillospiraceae bacterium]|nr:hypothetical protein [Oscillospiraceae bacterium]
MKEMIVQVGDQEFTARLYQNPTADELIRQLPLTLDMNELNGNEKYYYFSESLPADAGQIGKINAGDIMLYGSKCLVLFYDSFATPYSYTRIGYVENPAGLADALGDGNVEITFKLK